MEHVLNLLQDPHFQVFLSGLVVGFIDYLLAVNPKIPFNGILHGIVDFLKK